MVTKRNLICKLSEVSVDSLYCQYWWTACFFNVLLLFLPVLCIAVWYSLISIIVAWLLLPPSLLWIYLIARILGPSNSRKCIVNLVVTCTRVASPPIFFLLSAWVVYILAHLNRQIWPFSILLFTKFLHFFVEVYSIVLHVYYTSGPLKVSWPKSGR